MSRHNNENLRRSSHPHEDTDQTGLKNWDAFEDEEEILQQEVKLKDKYAFALTLDEETGMPRVTAVGRGLMAKRIEEKAKEAGLTLDRDPDLAERLFKPSDDRVIPAPIYGIIAEILTFVYQLNEVFQQTEEPQEPSGDDEIDGFEDEWEKTPAEELEFEDEYNDY